MADPGSVVGILLLVLFFCVIVFTARLRQIIDKETKPVRPCPPHDWEYIQVMDKYNELRWTHFCRRCKKNVKQISNDL